MKKNVNQTKRLFNLFNVKQQTLKTLALVLVIFTGFWFIVATGDGDSTTESTTPASIGTLSDDMKSISPYMGSLLDLSLWASWAPDLVGLSPTVLDKMFDPENGVENIFSPVESLDEYIETINSCIEYWDTDGVHEVGDDRGSATMTVDTTITSVTIPFFGNKVNVDRAVKFETDDGGTFFIAFSTDPDQQHMVVKYIVPSTPVEEGVYYAFRNASSGDMEIWHASVSTMKIIFKWKGNTEENWFSITQNTDAAGGNWEVVGGGSIEDGKEMAFMSRNDEDGNSPYFLTITYNQLTTATDPGTITDATASPPDGSTDALKYITSGETEFPGWLGPENYPANLAAMASDWCDAL